MIMPLTQKGRHPVHSQSNTTSVGSSGLETSTTSEAPFVLGVQANLPGFRTMSEGSGLGVVHFNLLYFCGQHQELAS